MLDRFQRSTVEQIRSHAGRVSISLLGDENGTSITTGVPDKKLAHDIALAFQSYYDRHNKVAYRGEDKERIYKLSDIFYKEVPAKTDDKICKECDYFLDNGVCTLEKCPCEDDMILEKINKK